MYKVWIRKKYRFHIERKICLTSFVHIPADEIVKKKKKQLIRFV